MTIGQEHSAYPDPNDGKQSLIGVNLSPEGRPEVQTTHRDGSTERHGIDTTRIITEGPQPQTWHPAGGALVEKPSHGLTRQQRVDQSVRVEAALLQATSSARASVQDIAPLMRQHAPAILAKVLHAMGGDWATLGEEIWP